MAHREIGKDMSLADDIDQKGEGVTSWEAGFLDNVLKQLDDGVPLTPKQGKTLEKIWEQRV